jgi:hypothetical protein
MPEPQVTHERVGHILKITIDNPSKKNAFIPEMMEQLTAAAMSKPHSSARRGDALKLHRGATSGEVSTALQQPQKPAIEPITDHGTALAIDNSKLGVAALFPRSASRGGARIRPA